MKATWLAGMLVGAALTCAPIDSLAQDEGKTAAAELDAASQAALQQLTASVPLAKAAAAPAHAILVFPKVSKAGLGVGGQCGVGARVR